MTNEVLGFDIRTADELDVARRWDERRRAQYLLRTDVSWVASVDTIVCPSVFEFGDGAHVNHPDTGAMRLVPQDLHQQALGLWRDVRKMQESASETPLQGTKTIQIAITVFGNGKVISGYPLDDLLKDGTDPRTLGDGWDLLGYDVATQFLLSGLSNCGYSEQEKNALSRVWSDKLNKVGLLTDLDDAVVFRELTDRRVPEHAPFLVFGLYELHL
jgi:hypothetical protein